MPRSLAGGVDSGSTIGSGGSESVFTGGTDSGVTIMAGARKPSRAARRCTTWSAAAARRTVYSGGLTEFTTVSGGTEIGPRPAGNVLSNVVEAGGSGTVMSGALDSASTIAGSGYEFISNGGTGSGIIVSSGGRAGGSAPAARPTARPS